jgi:WD40 repeat protein
VRFIGNYLYAACTGRKNTHIKVYSLEKGELVMTLKGHRGVIYKMEPTASEKLMVTAGSDNLVKVWRLPENTGEYIDEDESEELILCECFHTAAIYSVSVVYQPLQEVLHVLSCCYDGSIRLWECHPQEKRCEVSKEVNINDFTRSAGRVYPTASAVAEGSYFIVGDSIGEIRVFDFSREKLTLRCLLAPEELKGDAVLSLHILNKSHLMIQAKDNLIRHFELIGSKIRLHQTYAGAVFDTELANCAVSPDNKYLLSPSEAGKPMLWDVFTGTQIGLDHLGLNIKGKLVCCDWHPKYNLVALSGFVDYCPVFVYGNVLSEAEIKMVSAQLE